MEMTKRLRELTANDREAIARMFGLPQPADVDDTIVLRTTSTNVQSGGKIDALPEWCNVLEGLSDDDLQELRATFDLPVHVAHPRE